MTKFMLPVLALWAMLVGACKPGNPDNPPLPSADKLSGITYQLNVYSFADSDGDGWGDIRGVTEHLDYLDAIGATALWLSPLQEAASYHNYDILDYSAINPRLGTEADLQDLINKAREYNIDIYMDYVLNHSGRGEWFKGAVSSSSSLYRSFYVLSYNPSADVAAGKVDNYGGAKNPGMGDWHSATSGDVGYKGRLHFKVDWSAKTVTVTETSEAAQNPNADASLWLWVGSAGAVGLYPTASNIYEITIDVDTDWGFLVRSSLSSWDGGTKWGGAGGAIEFGKPFKLDNSTAADITFGGSSIWYFASFDSSMPDLNYGPYDKASESPAFKALAESADKWIKMGVNGLRLDAVMWIYQLQAEANASFLKQWYDRCNATYKARGGQGDLYMVGEAWEESTRIASYYKGLPSLFNFSFWWTLKDRIGRGSGKDFAKTVVGIRSLYKPYRSDFIDAIKLSNHDENRAGSDLGKSVPKMKLAGAVLLTSPGKPFIYQGEELGYWGVKDKGDEYIRTPIRWTVDGSVPTKALSGKVDFAMLTGKMSVEYQEKDEESILNVYRSFARARNTNKALARGEITPVNCDADALSVWTMTCEDQTLLVVHNFRNTPAKTVLSGFKPGKALVSNGEYSASEDGTISMQPFASAVFELKQ